jgi:RND family efflux transporter MFP subunit
MNQSLATLSLLATLALVQSGCDGSLTGPTAGHSSNSHGTASNATSDNSNSGQSAVRVAVVHPQKKTLVRMVQQPGEIQAIEQTPILPKVSGYIREVLVDIGDRVKTGQLLAEISIPEYEQELKQKQALVAQAQAESTQARAAINVAKAMLTSAEANVAEAEAAVMRATAEQERAQSEFSRMSDLFADKAITKKILDETQAAQRTAEAARAEALARLNSVKAQVAEKQAIVEQAQADAKAVAAKEEVAAADEERLRAIHAYTKITAPYDSVVTERHIDTGHFVQPGKSSGEKPLFTLARADIARIMVDVPEADAGLVATDGEATIRIPSTGHAVPGKVTRSGWTLNPATRTLRVAIDLPNDEGKLRPGLYVLADLKIAERKDVLAIPKSATFVDEQQTYCLTVSPDNTLVRTKVVLGLRAADDVEVVEGLTAEDRVIPGNVAAYRPGQAVEVISK